MFIFCCYIDFGYQWNGFSEVHYMSSPEYLQKHLPIVKKCFGYNLGTVVLKSHLQDTKPYQNDTILQ